MKKTNIRHCFTFVFLFFYLPFSFSFFYQTKELENPISITENISLSEDTKAIPDTISILEHFKKIGNILEITLEMDLEEFIENKFSGKYYPAKFTYTDDEGTLKDYKIKVKPRGKFRRKICSIPPIKLKFKKKHLKKNGFKKHNTYKFVNFCEKGSFGERLVLREYLAYQLFNQLTEESFRVQLAKIKYLDTSGKREPKEKYGFLIENDDELAERLEGEICECRGETVKGLNPNQYQKVALFNYMIGNTDWRIDLLHNVRLIQKKESSQLFVIPYDFDFSGLVDADYARPSPDFNIRSVRERHYRGFRFDNPHFFPVQELFLEKELELFQTITEMHTLDRSSRRWAQKYIKGFYRILKNEKRKARRLVPDRFRK